MNHVKVEFYIDGSALVIRTYPNGDVEYIPIPKPSYKENDPIHFEIIPKDADLSDPCIQRRIAKNKIGYAALVKYNRLRPLMDEDEFWWR